MSYSIIRLQEEHIFQVVASGSFYQPRNLAVNVASYHLIVPFVSIRKNSANSLTSTGVKFDFATAPVLGYQDETEISVDRFVDFTNATVTVSGTAFSTTTLGKTYTISAPSDPGLKAIANPGGLLIWKLTIIVPSGRMCHLGYNPASSKFSKR